MIDRTERAMIAHRDALQEIQRGGHAADIHLIIDALTEINHWTDRDQRGELTSEILYALEEGELDAPAEKSLASTLDYLGNLDDVGAGWESGTCDDGEYITSAGNYALITDGDDGSGMPEQYEAKSLTVDAPWLAITRQRNCTETDHAHCPLHGCVEYVCCVPVISPTSTG